MMVRREGIEPQPAGWESLDQPTAAVCFGAGQQRVSGFAIMGVIGQGVSKPNISVNQNGRLITGVFPILLTPVRLPAR
jgi:hypothetical protein